MIPGDPSLQMPSGWSVLMLTILLTPAASALLVMLTRSKRAAETITIASATLVTLQVAGLIAGVIGETRLSAFGDFFSLDALGALILIPIAGVGLVTAIYSVGYMGEQYDRGVVDRSRLVRYYEGFNLFMLTMLVVPLANNVGVMWVAIEATTLVSVFMIMLYTTEGAIEAAWKYLIIATVGLSLALFGIVLFSYAFSSASSTATSDGTTMNWTAMAAAAKTLNPDIIKIAYIFVLVGLGTKAGIAPMHTWLPDAHGEAPSPMSALLSGVLLNCAVYAVLRFNIITTGTLGTAFPDELLVCLGLLSMGIAAASIYFAKDMKRMLAFSSIEHMGIISLSVGFGGFVGIFAGLFHILNHATAKPLMFFASGSVSQRYETKMMKDVRGIIKAMPATGALMLVGAMAMVGLPPFNIFASEFLALTAGFSQGQFVAVSIMILLLLVVFAGFMRHMVGMVFGGKVEPPTHRPSEGRGILMVAPMAVLAALVIVIGLYMPQPLQTLIRDAVQVFGQGATP